MQLPKAGQNTPQTGFKPVIVSSERNKKGKTNILFKLSGTHPPENWSEYGKN